MVDASRVKYPLPEVEIKPRAPGAKFGTGEGGEFGKSVLPRGPGPWTPVILYKGWDGVVGCRGALSGQRPVACCYTEAPRARMAVEPSEQNIQELYSIFSAKLLTTRTGAENRSQGHAQSEAAAELLNDVSAMLHVDHANLCRCHG